MVAKWACYWVAVTAAVTATGGQLAQAAAANPDPAAGAVLPREELTVGDIQAGFAQGSLSSEMLVKYYLGRVESLNTKGPALRAILEVNPDALTHAIAADKERKSSLKNKKKLPPLHGVPVLVKDTMATKDKMQTTAGSVVLLGSRVPRDAFVVEQLRKAGAIILGKANLAEWGFFRGFEIPAGWSGRGGQVVCPYNESISPSESSTGSAVAVSANMAPIALGGETDGSIVAPASVAGIVGLKPTLGLVSCQGTVPIAHTQDTIGPMTRTVTDAAILLGAIAKPNTNDEVSKSAWAKNGWKIPKNGDYTQFLKKDGLKGARIGVLVNAELQPEGPLAMQAPGWKRSLDTLSSQGAVLVNVTFPQIAETILSGDELYVLTYEFRSDLKSYLSTLKNTTVRNLGDVVDFYKKNPDGYDMKLWEMSLNNTNATEYKLAKKRSLNATKTQLDLILRTHQLDALVSLTDTKVASLGGQAGYPVINVPAGINSQSNAPYGVCFLGTGFSEPTLLRLAYAFEKAYTARVVPPV